jgi:putative ABC transport system ATP-binding protein
MLTTNPDASVVRLVDVGKTYPGSPDLEAVVACNLTIRSGEFVTIVGGSGSGKSTLLNLIGLLDRPTSGDYHLAGVPTAALRERDRAHLRSRSFGFVFQGFHLTDYRSCVENVMLAMTYRGGKPSLAKAMTALESVGLGDRVDSLPRELSGGQRQRVAIARAICCQPSILLCDEPTGNLDSQTTAHILSILDDLHRNGSTIMLVTHDAAVASRASRRLRMEDGVLSEESDSRGTQA